MKMYGSSGYSIVEPDGSGGLKLIPIVAFVARSEEDKTVEPIPESSSDGYSPIHPGRLIQRPDGWLVMSNGKVGNAAAAVEYFANYQPSRDNRRQRWPQQALLAPLAVDADNLIYYL
jgi:hypothetical protein